MNVITICTSYRFFVSGMVGLPGFLSKSVARGGGVARVCGDPFASPAKKSF